MWWEKANNLTNRSNFERGSDDNDQIHSVLVMVDYPIVKEFRELLAEERDIGLRTC